MIRTFQKIIATASNAAGTRLDSAMLARIQAVTLSDSDFEGENGEPAYFVQVRFQQGPKDKNVKETLLSAIEHTIGREISETQASIVANKNGMFTILLLKSEAEVLDKTCKDSALNLYREETPGVFHS